MLVALYEGRSRVKVALALNPSHLASTCGMPSPVHAPLPLDGGEKEKYIIKLSDHTPVLQQRLNHQADPGSYICKCPSLFPFGSFCGNLLYCVMVQFGRVISVMLSA